MCTVLFRSGTPAYTNWYRIFIPIQHEWETSRILFENTRNQNLIDFQKSNLKALFIWLESYQAWNVKSETKLPIQSDFLNEFDGLRHLILKIPDIDLGFLNSAKLRSLKSLSINLKRGVKSANFNNFSFLECFSYGGSIENAEISTKMPNLVDFALPARDLRKIDFACMPNLLNLYLSVQKDNVFASNVHEVKKLRGLSIFGSGSLDFSILHNFTELEGLYIGGSGIEVVKMADFSRLKKLKWLKIEGFRGSSDFSWLNDLENIEEITIHYVKEAQIDSFAGLANHKTLKSIYGFTQWPMREQNKLKALLGDKWNAKVIYGATYEIHI
jgi:hypothetical protein